MSVPARTVWMLAVAAGLSAANLYYAQPLLEVMARDLGTSRGSIGLVVTWTQLGYAAGLVLLVPLGDLVERRRLIVTVLLATALSLIGVALAPNVAMLSAFSLAVGATSVVAQVAVPFAATLASDRDRGRVVGSVMTGLLLGILSARVVAGAVGELLGWRAMYLCAAAAMVGLSALLRAELPRSVPSSTLRYPAVLRSVAALVTEEPVLRRRAVYGAMAFACFSVLWTSLTFLLAGAPYGYGEATIGLFGLAGIAGALAASLAGRLADRGKVHQVTVAGLASIVVSFGLLAWGGRMLPALVAGIVVLDLGVQAVHITNQSLIYALRPDARARITAVYMTTFFIGGAFGSAAAAFMYERHGWLGTTALGAAFGGVALALHLQERR